MTDSLRQLQVDLDKVAHALEGREEEFLSLRNRAEAAGYSPAVGVLLRNHRAKLPELDDLRLRTETRQLEIAELNLQLMEWQAERKSLVDLDAATQAAVDAFDTPPDPRDVGALAREVRELLSIRLKLLASLIETGNVKLDKLVRLDSEQKRLLKSVEDESWWLAEHILWVRSTGIIGTQWDLFRSSLHVAGAPGRWKAVRAAIADDWRGSFWIWSLLLATSATLQLASAWFNRRLEQLGEVAERSSCVAFLPTAKALGYSILVTLPWPVLLWGAGWRITSISQGDNTLQAVGISLQVVAAVWMLLSLVWEVAEPNGLGHSHFEWPESSLAIVRRVVAMLRLGLLPALFVVAFAESTGDDDVAATLGRVAYLAAGLVAVVAAFRLVRPSSPIMQSIEQDHADSLVWRTRWLWATCVGAAPLILLTLSATGYHYTAVQLTGRATASVVCGLALLLLTSLLSRWLLVTYRSLAIRRGRERRQQMLQAAQAESDQPLPADTTPELRLSDVNTQARRLLRLSAGASLVAALYAIWADVLPALGAFGRITLGWDNAVAGLGADGLARPVTLADLIFAFIVGVATIFASRNLPGLMEIVVLQKLPLDAGARYAASTVSRYLIVVTGIILTFRVIGIGWVSVQWLVAAMTVGLGFGLQEIFANFVSGIILLFERPIRVG
ncbi:MAG: mechanosensitive ion channel, partial [Planctomycetales bacterium]|nr:mechanosensitive ion channel [Planctomycetales bacterium]